MSILPPPEQASIAHGFVLAYSRETHFTTTSHGRRKRKRRRRRMIMMIMMMTGIKRMSIL